MTRPSRAALFAVISSKMFPAWHRLVGGRIRSDLRFGNTSTWNTFPLSSISAAERERIITAGQAGDERFGPVDAVGFGFPWSKHGGRLSSLSQDLSGILRVGQQLVCDRSALLSAHDSSVAGSAPSAILACETPTVRASSTEI